MAAEDLDRFRELLQSSHTFPGPYLLAVITHNDPESVQTLRAALADRHAAVGDGAEWTITESRNGRYVSHRVTLHCASPDDVLALYETVRTLPGVVTIL